MPALMRTMLHRTCQPDLYPKYKALNGKNARVRRKFSYAT